MNNLNPFADIFPLPPPKTAVVRATATEQYRFVKKDCSKCAARAADLRAIHGDGHLLPLDIIAAYYISAHTSDTYVFSIRELESVRLAMLLGRPTPNFRKTIVERIDAIWTELLSLALEPSNA
jgi:hypothetical protein